MPFTTDVDRPRAAVTIAERYLRIERPLSGLVAVLVAAVSLGTYWMTSFWPAILVAVGVLVVLRTPVLRSRGSFRLGTDADVETVVAEFTGPTPPVLPFQWGIADKVARGEGATTYRVAYLLGLRSVEMSVETRAAGTDEGARRVELAVAANGSPWATYEATIHREAGRTVVDVEYDSERRFGLRRLPQQLVATRYRDDALEAQGYSVLDRDAEFGL
jgi:hypothetical protein